MISKNNESHSFISTNSDPIIWEAHGFRGPTFVTAQTLGPLLPLVCVAAVS